MSAPKRRLSSGSGLLSLCADEDSDDDDMSVGLQEKSIYTFPKKATSRRRSSFGGSNSSKSPVNAVEQARIAEMYKTVIQMSSENKLNEKNSWNYDLIDHMGNLIKDDSRGVNFQKASCTLDASVKIYSNRVDDTYSSSHRILESLSRNGSSAQDSNDHDDDENDDGEDGENNPEGGATGGRKKGNKTSTRLNIATTIERNVAALNAVKLENDVAVDPMFHKISKAFDEGGAKGMLMNNLRVAATGSSLSFHFPAAYAEPATTSTTATSSVVADDFFIDLGDLLQRADIAVAGLSELSVCPALAMYRDQICLPKEEIFLRNLSEVLTSTATHAWPTAAAVDMPNTSATRMSTGGAGAGGDWDDANNDNDDYFDGGGDDDFAGDYEQATPSGRVSTGGGRRSSAPFPSGVSAVGSPADSTTGGGGGGGGGGYNKLRWDDLEGLPGSSFSATTGTTAAAGTTGGGGVSRAMAADLEVLMQGMESIAISNSGPSEYSYFDSNAAFGSSNAWAGSKHWKYATRKRTAATAGTTTADASAPGDAEGGAAEAEAEGGAAATKKGRGKKPTKKSTAAKKTASAATGIEFTLEFADESEFDLPTTTTKGAAAKAKTDPTVQTAATLSKQDGASEALFLPADAKVQIKDLCRLYLAPLVMIPANDAQRAALAQSALAAKQRSGSSKIDKFLSGQSGSERVWGLSAPANLQTATRVMVTGGAGAGAGSQNMNESFGDDGGYGGDYGDDGDDAGFGYYGGDGQENVRTSNAGDNASSSASQLPLALSGLSINEGQLLQADRKVEKIEIGYAKVSKRVNIQRLKADIWSNIRTALPAAEEGEEGSHTTTTTNPTTNTAAEQGEGALSFQSMIAELAAGDEVRQRDVTLPFYFICLLHLANEHNLKIEDREDMSDLIITPGMK